MSSEFLDTVKSGLNAFANFAQGVQQQKSGSTAGAASHYSRGASDTIDFAQRLWKLASGLLQTSPQSEQPAYVLNLSGRWRQQGIEGDILIEHFPSSGVLRILFPAVNGGYNEALGGAEQVNSHSARLLAVRRRPTGELVVVKAETTRIQMIVNVWVEGVPGIENSIWQRTDILLR